MKRLPAGLLVLLILAAAQGTAFAQPDAAMDATGGAAVSQNGDKLSLDIKGMDVIDVFRLLSMRGNLNIIAGKNVTGKVTLFIKDVDIWDAFEIIVAANELAYEKRGDLIYVMTQRDYELAYGQRYEDKRIVKTVRLKYVKAEEVSKAVSQLKTNIGRVVADEASKTVVLMDVPDTVVEMEKVIKTLDVPLTTKVYSLQYASIKDIKDKLEAMLTKNVGSIQVDERTNKAAITDVSSRIPEFDKVIAEFDVKHKEVLIEAKIIQVTLDDEFSMGINWNALFKTMADRVHYLGGMGVGLNQVSKTILPVDAGAGLQVGELSTEGYQYIVQALQTYGKTNLLSSPRVIALNNQEAKILVGTNQPYATRAISQVSGGASNIEEENVTFIDLGVKLSVTPTINDSDYVTMKIKPEVSSSSSDYTIVSSGNTIPIVKTTTTDTTVMVKNGATIVIGGLIEDTYTETTKQVPGFHKLPLIGNLFFKAQTRGTTKAPEKAELVVFLTPRIVSGNDEPAGTLTVQDLAHDDAMKKLESPGQLIPGDADDLIIDKLMPEDYYTLISNMITKEVEKRRPSVPVYGEVVLSFELNKEGALISRPKLYRGNNKVLSEIGIMSISSAAPFPAFPRNMQKDAEMFQIAISYEE